MYLMKRTFCGWISPVRWSKRNVVALLGKIKFSQLKKRTFFGWNIKTYHLKDIFWQNSKNLLLCPLSPTTYFDRLYWIESIQNSHQIVKLQLPCFSKKRHRFMNPFVDIFIRCCNDQLSTEKFSVSFNRSVMADRQILHVAQMIVMKQYFSQKNLMTQDCDLMTSQESHTRTTYSGRIQVLFRKAFTEFN